MSSSIDENDVDLVSIAETRMLSSNFRHALKRSVLKTHYEEDILIVIQNEINEEDKSKNSRRRKLLRHIQFSQMTELKYRVQKELSLFQISLDGGKTEAVTSYDLVKTLLVDPYHMNSNFTTGARTQNPDLFNDKALHKSTDTMLLPKWESNSCFCDSTLVAILFASNLSDSLLFSRPHSSGIYDTNSRWLCWAYGCENEMDDSAIDYYYKTTEFLSNEGVVNRHNFSEREMGVIVDKETYKNTFFPMKNNIIKLSKMMRTVYDTSSLKTQDKDRIRNDMKNIVKNIWKLCTEEYGGDLDGIGTQNDPGQFLDNIVVILHGQMMYFPLIFNTQKVRLIGHTAINARTTFNHKQNLSYTNSLGLKAIKDTFTVQELIQLTYMKTETEYLEEVDEPMAYRILLANEEKFKELGISNHKELVGLSGEILFKNRIMSPRQIFIIKLYKENKKGRLDHNSKVLLYENNKLIRTVEIKTVVGVFMYRVSSIMCRYNSNPNSNSGHYVIYFSYQIKREPDPQYIWCFYNDMSSHVESVNIDSKEAKKDIEKYGYVLVLELMDTKKK
jgi:hypothetical protein